MLYYNFFVLIQFFVIFLSNWYKGLLSIAVIIAILFSGIRYETGYDFNVYKSFFENVESYENLFEPGFYYLIAGAATVGLSSASIFFLFSIATNSIAFLFFRKLCLNSGFAFLLYLLIPGLYLNSFSIIRQSLAVSLFAWSVYRLISKGRTFEFIIFCIISTSIHLPAFIAFSFAYVIYLIREIVITTSKSLFILFVSICASLLSIDQYILNFFIDTKYIAYANDQEAQSFVKFVGSLLVTLFIVMHSKHFNMIKTLSYIYKLWLLGMVFFFLFKDITPLTRINYYFTILSIPLYVSITYAYYKLNRFLTGFCIIFFYILAFVNALYMDTLSDNEVRLLPYKTIFSTF